MPITDDAKVDPVNGKLDRETVEVMRKLWAQHPIHGRLENVAQALDVEARKASQEAADMDCKFPRSIHVSVLFANEVIAMLREAARQLNPEHRQPTDAFKRAKED